MVKLDYPGMIPGGAVMDLAWTDDSQKLVAVGTGKKRAVAVNIESKTSAGDLIGHTASLLCCDIKNPKPYALVLGGEDKECQFFKGPPFKFEKTFQKLHTNFINKCLFSQDGNTFVTVSSDKSVKVNTTDTYETLITAENVHEMGIIDFTFTDKSN
jgi:WD40 repeat protein